jgi:hypothetical protein
LEGTEDKEMPKGDRDHGRQSQGNAISSTWTISRVEKKRNALPKQMELLGIDIAEDK